MGSPALERGSRLRVRLGEMDLISLDIRAQYQESLLEKQDSGDSDDEEDDVSEDEESSDDIPVVAKPKAPVAP